MRDFGFVSWSYRQASVGADYGFWLTPYRFWHDEKLANVTCVR